MLDALSGRLKALDVEIADNYPLSMLSAVRIGGSANLLVKPRSISSFIDVLRALHGEGIKYKIVGRMTNILPPDSVYDGVIVSTSALSGYRLDGTALTAECGLCLGSIAEQLMRARLGGFEELVGIPGSIGGMVTMNAGSYGRELSDILLCAEVYSPDEDKIHGLSPEDLRMSYRYSDVRERGFAVLTASIALERKDCDVISASIRRCRTERLRSQPSAPSLGSTFKRPSVGYASKMIDECGLRGYRIGGAAVSEKHAGFIVNLGGATAADYRELIAICRESVAKRFGVMLEPEIEILE